MNKKRSVTEFKSRYELVYVNIRMQKDCLNINHVMLTSLCKNGGVVVLSTTQILKHTWTRWFSASASHYMKWTHEHVSFEKTSIISFTFYPKRLTIAFRLYIFHQYLCSLGIEPTTLCAANAMLYHWATQEHRIPYIIPYTQKLHGNLS